MLRTKKVNGWLKKGLRNSLEGARKKWCIEENSIVAKRRRVDEVMVAQLFRDEARRKAFGSLE